MREVECPGCGASHIFSDEAEACIPTGALSFRCPKCGTRVPLRHGQRRAKSGAWWAFGVLLAAILIPVLYLRYGMNRRAAEPERTWVVAEEGLPPLSWRGKADFDDTYVSIRSFSTADEFLGSMAPAGWVFAHLEVHLAPKRSRACQVDLSCFPIFVSPGPVQLGEYRPFKITPPSGQSGSVCQLTPFGGGHTWQLHYCVPAGLHEFYLGRSENDIRPFSPSTHTGRDRRVRWEALLNPGTSRPAP